MNVLDEIRKDISGAEILFDWVGSGNPVHAMVSEARAKICEPCSENREPSWWEKHIKEPIAQWIRAELELKNNLNISVPNEQSLGICRVCGCCNALAVHVPIAHIKAHTTKEMLAKFPDKCWKKIELTGSIEP